MLEVKRKPSVSSAQTSTAIAPTPAESLRLQAYAEQLSPTSHRPKVTGPILVKPTGPLKENQQTKLPVIVGEAHFKGNLPVDGIVLGQLGASCSLNVRQKSKVAVNDEPELSGEITFRDMVRVNGHISGTIYSEKGTLIVDTSARIDADVEVGVAVIGGTINGDIVAHEKVEVGPNAKIRGNIWTRSIVIKDGAIFEGVCKMIA
jgi:cytoskeletal protein CcmA (bactofilin family)